VAYTFPGEREAVQSEPIAADTPSAAGFTRTFVRKQGNKQHSLSQTAVCE